MKNVSVEIWSDIACPWCYVGKRRFEAALAGFEQRGQVQLRWRSFELDPAAPRVQDGDASYAERLAKKYSTTIDKAQEMIRTMTDTAAGEGLDFDFERIRPGNTFDAHRLVHLARGHGQQDEAKERLFRAYLSEGEAIGERDVLVRLAGELGLDPQDTQRMLASDELEGEVRADEDRARILGISGVPFFVVGGRYSASGAQSPDLLLRMLQKAWSEPEVDTTPEA